jgi:hypothetical protein
MHLQAQVPTSAETMCGRLRGSLEEGGGQREWQPQACDYVIGCFSVMCV